MAPPRKILKQQLEILVDYLEQNKDISGTTPLTNFGLHNTKTKWGIVAKKLNAVEDGAKKPAVGWKKYWFEWRHKCRKKATYMSTSGHNLTFTDLELRALNINNNDETFQPSAKTIEIFLAENSNSEQQLKVDNDQNIEDNISRKRTLKIEKSTRNTTPPPEWAMELEERRIAAEERIAKALETIANMMQAQDDRRGIIEQRVVETLSAIAGSLQNLNHKNSLQQDINNDLMR